MDPIHVFFSCKNLKSVVILSHANAALLLIPSKKKFSSANGMSDSGYELTVN
jgi:hypothetical protein